MQEKLKSTHLGIRWCQSCSGKHDVCPQIAKTAMDPCCLLKLGYTWIKRSGKSQRAIGSLILFFIDVKDCADYRVIVSNNAKGIIHGFTNKHNDKGNICFLKVTVPVGMYMRAYSWILDKSKLRCMGGAKMAAYESKAHPYQQWVYCGNAIPIQNILDPRFF